MVARRAWISAVFGMRSDASFGAGRETPGDGRGPAGRPLPSSGLVRAAPRVHADPAAAGASGAARRGGADAVLPPWQPFGVLVAFALGLAGTLSQRLVWGRAALRRGCGDLPPGVNILLTVAQDVAFVGAAVFVVSRVARPAAWQFGLRGARPGPFLGWLVVAFLAFVALSAAYSALVHIGAQEELPDELGADGSTLALFAAAFLVTVIAPFAEELFFRGFVFTSLRRWGAVARGDPHRGDLRRDPPRVGPRRAVPADPGDLRPGALPALREDRVALPVHRAARDQQLHRVRRDPRRLDLAAGRAAGRVAGRDHPGGAGGPSARAPAAPAAHG